MSGRHLGNARMGFGLWELEIYLSQNMEGDDNAQPMQVNQTPVHQSHATAAEIVGDPVMFSYNVASRFNLSEQNRAELGELARVFFFDLTLQHTSDLNEFLVY